MLTTAYRRSDRCTARDKLKIVLLCERSDIRANFTVTVKFSKDPARTVASKIRQQRGGRPRYSHTRSSQKARFTYNTSEEQLTALERPMSTACTCSRLTYQNTKIISPSNTQQKAVIVYSCNVRSALVLIVCRGVQVL